MNPVRQWLAFHHIRKLSFYRRSLFENLNTTQGQEPSFVVLLNLQELCALPTPSCLKKSMESIAVELGANVNVHHLMGAGGLICTKMQCSLYVNHPSCYFKHETIVQYLFCDIHF